MDHFTRGAQADAHRLLLKETFAHIEQQQIEAYRDLARESARLNNTQALFFMYNGMVFPEVSPNGTPIRGVHAKAPPLHYSLIEQFDTINGMRSNDMVYRISNFFSEVLEASCNNIVLEALLPPVLVGHLSSKLTAVAFTALNRGYATEYKPSELPSVDTTKKRISEIKSNYSAALEHLRHLLMDQLLLKT